MKKLIMLGLAAFAFASVQPAMAKDKEVVAIPTPPAGMGQVVFYRPGSLMGMAISCNVREGGVMVGPLANGKYFVAPLTPGKHQFTTKSEATDTLNLEVEEGETQYVKCKIGAGFAAGRPNLSPSDKAEFDKKHPKMKFKTEEERQADIAEDTAEKAKKAD